jgi:hypothetical protein
MRFHIVLFASLCVAPALCRSVSADPPAPNGPRSASAEKHLGGFAHISERVLKDLLHREVKLNQFVAETMMNMTTRGTARIDCRIGLDLIPNPHMANVRLTMIGNALMDDAVGTMRSIRIYSSSRTEISGYKDVFLVPEGLRLAPTRADCRTSIQVHDIEARLRLVERMAWRRAAQMQPQVEQAASRRASRRAEEQLEAEAGQPLGQMHHEYVDGVYNPLMRQGAFPDARFATTGNHLSVVFLTRRNPDTGPPTPPWDLAIGLADSYANEITGPLVGGKTHTDRQFADFMLTITGQTPRPLWVHDRTEPWSVTAAEERPIQVSFADDLVSVKFRIERATRGDAQLDRPIEISARYSLEPTVDGPRLIRKGDLAVIFIGPDGREEGAGGDAQFQQFLKRKFSGVFLSEIYFDGLMPPEGGSWGKLRRLTLKQLRSRDGWLSVGYVLKPNEPAATTTVRNAATSRP